MESKSIEKRPTQIETSKSIEKNKRRRILGDVIPMCSSCDEIGARYICSSCKAVSYCCRGCQWENWTVHVDYCSKYPPLASMETRVKEDVVLREDFSTFLVALDMVGRERREDLGQVVYTITGNADDRSGSVDAEDGVYRLSIEYTAGYPYVREHVPLHSDKLTVYLRDVYSIAYIEKGAYHREAKLVVSQVEKMLAIVPFFDLTLGTEKRTILYDPVSDGLRRYRSKSSGAVKDKDVSRILDTIAGLMEEP